MYVFLLIYLAHVVPVEAAGGREDNQVGQGVADVHLPLVAPRGEKVFRLLFGFFCFFGVFWGGGGEGSGEEMDEAPSHAALGPTDHHLRHTATRPTATGHQNVRAFVIFST